MTDGSTFDVDQDSVQDPTSQESPSEDGAANSGGSSWPIETGTPEDWGPEQWEAVSSPIRMELLGLAEAAQPCSINDLARDSGRRASSLYRHVQILVDSGLLRRCGTRPAARRPEILYRVSPSLEHFRSWIDGDDEAADRFVSLHEAALRAVARGFRAMFERRWALPRPERPPLRFWASHDVTWIDESRARELNEISRRIKAVIDEGRRDREGILVQVDVMVWERLDRVREVQYPAAARKGSSSTSSTSSAPSSSEQASPER